MNLTLSNINEVLDSKVYVKESSPVTFGSPKQYLDRFVNLVDQNGFEYSKIMVQDQVVNANEDGSNNVAYPKVLVEAKAGDVFRIQDESAKHLQEMYPVVGMIYGLNSTPVIKTYYGFNVVACLNLSIFNPAAVFSQSALNGLNDINGKLEEYFRSVESESENLNNSLDYLRSRILSMQEINNFFGKFLIHSFSNPQLPQSVVGGAANLIQDKKSNYYGYNNDGSSLWNIYNAATSIVTDSTDIIYRPEKTLAITKFMFNYN